jgi:hypothetical protein
VPLPPPLVRPTKAMIYELAKSGPNLPLATPNPEPFACPNCGARYTLVHAERDAASVSGQLVCRSCGSPLNGR